MGFASHDPIIVNGIEVAPVDVLMKLVKRPGNKFFTEDDESILTSDLTGFMDISVGGRKGWGSHKPYYFLLLHRWS